MSDLRFAWVGFHAEGLPALDALLTDGAPIRDVLTLRPDLAAKRSGGVDLRPVCERHGVALHEITNINEPPARAILKAASPDVVFVIGWHQIVQPATLALARIGMVGAHASVLPKNRGSAPINWALIRGESESGNTLFWLNEGVDAGDVIDQVRYPITPYDTCATLYARVASANREMLRRLVPRLLAGEVPRQPQPEARDESPVLPRRRPADGGLDWAQPVRDVYNFIRALTRPYPGAFSAIEGKRWRVWHAALAHCAGARVAPGTVLGPVVSPVDEACGQLVACADGSLVILELEAEDGEVLRGRALSDRQWTGRRWAHA
jgi:methionyl-tRNA formyltransferase